MSRQTERKVQIKLSDVKAMLKQGFTRLEKDDAGKGSIQAHYGLNQSDVKTLFQNPQLKGLRTILPKENPFIIVDDVAEEDSDAITETTDENVEPVEETTNSEAGVLMDEMQEAMEEEVQEESSAKSEPAASPSLNWDNLGEDAPELAGKPEERSH